MANGRGGLGVDVGAQQRAAEPGRPRPRPVPRPRAAAACCGVGQLPPAPTRPIEHRPLDPTGDGLGHGVGQGRRVAGQGGGVAGIVAVGADRSAARAGGGGLASGAMATMLADMSRPVRIEPGPGQESVWDYPRPPRIEPCSERVVVRVAGLVLADTTRALRVLETSQPPAFYLPPDDVDLDRLEPSATAHLVRVEGRGQPTSRFGPATARAVDAAWTYRHPERRASRPSPTTWPSTRPAWTPASWATSRCRPAKAPSTAAGSPPGWSGPSRARRAPCTGEPTPTRERA